MKNICHNFYKTIIFNASALLECNDADAGRKICECLLYILSISTDNIL